MPTGMCVGISVCVWLCACASIPGDESGAAGYSKLAGPLSTAPYDSSGMCCLFLVCELKASSGNNNQLLMFDEAIDIPHSAHTHTYTHTHTEQVH